MKVHIDEIANLIYQEDLIEKATLVCGAPKWIPFDDLPYYKKVRLRQRAVKWLNVHQVLEAVNYVQNSIFKRLEDN